jgi:general nucleoside transport system ATP-binding protein
MSAGEKLVQLECVSKRFGQFLANDDVSIAIPPGKVVALVGENGAGKTTAMNLLAGLYVPDSGRIYVRGQRLQPGSPRESVRAGIGMVHQQFKLVDTMTGLENISLAMDRGRFLRRRRTGPAIHALMRDVGFALDLDRYVWQMPLAARQQLEVLRTLLTAGTRLLILDEPTSVLSEIESAELFNQLRRIKATGRSVVLISHKLKEVLGVADEIVVMRAGRVVHTGPIENVTLAQLSRLIVGDKALTVGNPPPPRAGHTVLKVEHLDVANDLGLQAVQDVSFEVRAGELVAIVGVSGNGQMELMEAIGGLRRPRSGTIVAPRKTGCRGFGYIPSQHLEVALAPNMSVAENSILGHHRSKPFRWWLQKRDVDSWASKVVQRFGVKGQTRQPVRQLSGGNLQRVILGRELAGDPELIVASYPTRGLDVASAAEIRGALAARAAAGAAVLIATEEIEESLEIANRILVMHQGRIVGQHRPEALELAHLGRLMTTGIGS